MRTKQTIVLFALTAIVALAGFFFIRSLPKDKKNQENLPLADSVKLSQSYTFEQLQLYPIRNSQAKLNDSDEKASYTSLREAIEEQKVKITEINDGDGAVNTLMVENTSQDTLYLMSGEIVQGGKQDRIIAEDRIIPPGDQSQEVPVFCVEQGRWEYDSDSNVDSQKFKNYYGVASMKMREVVSKEKNQSKVWEEVARSNTENKVSSETYAYTDQKESEDFQEKYQAYYDYFMEKFSKEKDVIGVTGVTGKRIIGSDIFASPELFQKQFPSILSAYINEALTDGQSIEIPAEEVNTYFDEIMDAKDKNEEANYGKVFKHKGKKLHFSTYSKKKEAREVE